MNNRSFTSRLSWRIIGIVSVIFLAIFIVIGLGTQYVITNETASASPLMLVLFLLLIPLYRSGEHIGSRPGKNRVLYRQAREVVISSKDLIDLYLDGEQLPGSQFHLKILPGALPLRLPKLETE